MTHLWLEFFDSLLVGIFRFRPNQKPFQKSSHGSVKGMLWIF